MARTRSGHLPSSAGHVVQQPLRVVGDPEVPLGQLPLGHRRVAALAQPLDDLLVGQHGLVVRAPVDVRVLPVRQALLVEAQEQPLGPPVVLGVGGVQPTAPVDAQRVAVEGARLGVDVRVRPLGRVRVALDGGVLRRQPERVPAHRVHDVVALQPPEPRHDVAHDERLGVTHVQVAGGVREHVEHVAALAAAIVERPERVVGLPERLPLVLRGDDVVPAGLMSAAGRLDLAHCSSSCSTRLPACQCSRSGSLSAAARAALNTSVARAVGHLVGLQLG